MGLIIEFDLIVGWVERRMINWVYLEENLQIPATLNSHFKVRNPPDKGE